MTAKFVCLLFIAALALAIAAPLASGHAGYRKTFDQVMSDATEHLQTRDFPENWFTNMVDHFNLVDLEEYQQRYFINTEFFVPTSTYSPVFLYLGCEGPLSSSSVGPGKIMYEWAQKSGALLIGLEHRFYGKSQPKPTWSLDSLKLLTMEQALADTAYFIKYFITPQYNFAQTHPIVVFGGSYGGLLVAQARSSYPNLIYAAVAASGVYDPKYDLSEFLDWTLQSTKVYGGQQCLDNLERATKFLETKLSTGKDADAAYASSKFPVCTPFDVRDTTLDHMAFWSMITDSFIQIVQYNRQNGPGFTIEKLCKALAAPNTDEDKFVAWADIHKTQLLAGGCYDWRFDAQVAAVRDEKFVSEGQNMRQWWYQTASAFGWYQPSTAASRAVYGGNYDIAYFDQFVQACFGTQFNRENVEKHLTKTIAKYNQYTFRDMNVLFTAGSIDPWITLAITNRNNAPLGLYSYLVTNTSHCAPLYSPQSYDPVTLTNARKQMFDDMTTILSRFPSVIANQF